ESSAADITSNTSESSAADTASSANDNSQKDATIDNITNVTNNLTNSVDSKIMENNVQISYSTLIQQLSTTNELALDEEALTHVDKDDFLQYFTLNGSATYDASTGIVTLTPDENNEVGNFSLTSKIDMNTSFTLIGQVNLGSDPNGADGIGFAFHNGNTTDIGNAGGNLGIGGLQDAIGFKLDTWSNGYQAPSSDEDGSEVSSTDSNGFGWNGDSLKAPYGTFVNTSNQEITMKDGSTVQRWWAEDTAGSAQSLSKTDINGQFHDFVVQYDGATRTLTVNYTETDGNVLTWTTTVSDSYQAMAMIVSASTGGAKNLQQFKITSFDFKQAATVDVEYVDTTGKKIAEGTVSYPNGAAVNGTYETTQADVDGYTFIEMDDGSVTGAKSLTATGTLTQAGNNGTVIYVYAPAYTETTKTVNETINYIDQDGNSVASSHTAKPVTFLTVTNPVDGSTVIYYSTTTTDGTLDKETGIPTAAGWTKETNADFPEVANPVVKGYTAISNDAPDSDLTKVSAQTVDNSSNDLNFTVVYTKNASTVTTETRTVNETIHYVYKDGSKAADDYVATPVEFTRTVSTDAVTGEQTYGAWSADQTFGAVTSPDLKGYTPDQTAISAQTVTGDSADLEYTVVYTKNAPTVTTETKIVNETIHYVYKDGSKAADDYVATPVEFTRTVSTDAVTGEQTYGAWSADQTFGAVTSPAIKGYTPDQAEIGSQTVSGDSSDLDFTVVYAKNAPTITTESKTINETIHYVYKDGTTAHDDYVAKPVEFTREVSTDAVTGEKTYGSWSADQSFAAVTSPAIKGYTPDQAEIGSQTVSGDSSDLDFTVVYTKDAPTKPVDPSQPTTPTKPVNPSQPTTPTKPVNPSQPTTPTKPVNPSQPTTPIKPINPSQSTTPAKPVQAGQAAATNFVDQRLPQTDETDQRHMTLSGLLLLAMSSLLGLFGMTKRQRKE
ncbi:mucin-binding protein, partial [Lactiplantibacillus fabifermentans]